MYRSVQGPFPIHRLGNDIFGNADAADAPGMHTVESEFGPEPIDDEAAERFVRWKSIAVHAEPLQWRCASPPNRNNRPPVARLFSVRCHEILYTGCQDILYTCDL